MSKVDPPFDTIIVGAGLAGLIIAGRLANRAKPVAVLEKSKGVGGRMATRRTERAKFDHGAQFYTGQPPLQGLHERWMKKSLVTNWFDSDRQSHFKSVSGMTTLAKDLASDLDIRLEEKVIRIAKLENEWTLVCESGTEFRAHRIVVTSPLPQALEILRASEISYDPVLETVQYAKAVVGLFEVRNASDNVCGPQGYREIQDGPIFSIADQRSKGVSNVPALTVVLKPSVSDSVYELRDQDLSELILKALRGLDANFEATSLQIKKWRYSHPLTRIDGQSSSGFSMPAPGLYLAGDAFGGPSLNGAARSANALSDVLNSFDESR